MKLEKLMIQSFMRIRKVSFDSYVDELTGVVLRNGRMVDRRIRRAV